MQWSELEQNARSLGRRTVFSKPPFVSECFLKTALLRYHLHPLKFFHLKCVIQCVSALRYCPQSNFRTFLKDILYPLGFTPYPTHYPPIPLKPLPEPQTHPDLVLPLRILIL